MAQCQAHDDDVLICSCGYTATGHEIRIKTMCKTELDSVVPSEQRAFTETKMRSKWDSWGAKLREHYSYWLDLAKPHESFPMQAATYAAKRTEVYAENGRWSWSERGIGEKP